MPILPGEVYRVAWPYAVPVENDPFAIVLSEPRFNDQYVLIVPLFTERLTQSATQVAVAEELLGCPAVAHADKFTRLDVLNLFARACGPVARIEEDLFYELHLAVGEAVGANFGPGGFAMKWKPPGKEVPERGAVWRAFWLDSKDAPRPGLVMSDWAGSEDHVILMPFTSQRLEERRRLPSCVDLGHCVAQADQLEVIRAPQVRYYDGRVNKETMEAACRAVSHVIGSDL